MNIKKESISPATAMHYAETVGKMPPRYKNGQRFYRFTCEGDAYIIDAFKNDVPADMHKGWGAEVNEDAQKIVKSGVISPDEVMPDIDGGNFGDWWEDCV